MRLKLTFITLAMLTISACGPMGQNPSARKSMAYEFRGTTGPFFDENGVDYVHGGDKRVDEALDRQSLTKPSEQFVPAPQETKASPPPQVSPAPVSSTSTPTNRTLQQKLREFEITRFNGNDGKPTRFGTSHARIRVFFRNEQPAEFNSRLVKNGNNLAFEATSGRFQLKGELTDFANKSLGKFDLVETSTKEHSEIYYRAYKAKLTVREDRSRQVVAGSGFDRQLKNLRENTFGWVHNWSVLNGPAFYLVDIVRVGNEDATHAPIIAFKGESKRTGEREHKADSLTPEAATDVRLVGNSEDASRRLFAITLEDRQSAEQNTVMVDVESEEPEAPVKLNPEEEPVEFGPSGETLKTTPQQNNNSGHTQIDGSVQEGPVTPASGNSFLRVDNSLARTGRMTKDFDRNRSIPGVRAAIAEYQKQRRSSLENFYRHANPFRGMMEAIGAAYDVSPAYAYLTAIESSYFTGGKYKIERPIRNGKLLSSALGPFQILEETGRSLNMKITDLRKSESNNSDDAHDERRFFAPSACGAAKYIGRLVNIFDNGDATLAVLAYYQGEGGAAAALFCSFETSGNKQSCASRINHGMTGTEYQRYIRLAKNYSYKYGELERVAAIPLHMRQYVNRKLAVYFISSDLKRYGFSLAGAKTQLPNNGTVIPHQPIQDSTCRQAVSANL